jgi:hypothetical protein
MLKANQATSHGEIFTDCELCQAQDTLSNRKQRPSLSPFLQKSEVILFTFRGHCESWCDGT